MSLVTRCTACGTLFKVVADQLKISDGWVRCGQCAHVFDAHANLVDSQPASLASKASVMPEIAPISAISPASVVVIKTLEEQFNSLVMPQDSPHDSAYLQAYSQSGLKASSAKGDRALLQAAQSTSDANTAGSANSVMPDQELFAPGLLRNSDEIDSETGPSTASWASSEYASQQPDYMGISRGASISRSAEPTSLGACESSMPQMPSRPPGINTTEHSTQPLPTPSFVKQAQRTARWRSPWVRLGLVGLSVLLMAALALQVTLREKDWLAASYPQSKAGLDKLCQLAACRIEPLKQIEAMVVESSSFNRINKNNAQLEAAVQSYKLVVTLKNTGSIPVATPHIELSLQDIQDQTILRRVLSPADLNSSLERLMPVQEMTGSLALQIPTAQLAGSRINGYRVLAFYP